MARIDPLAPPEQLAALLQSRQTTLPRRLGEPGPDAAQLAAIVGAAAHAPDHGRQQPWRFVRVADDARDGLAEAFAQALIEREPDASPDALAQASAKAHRSPALLLAVVDAGEARMAAAIPLAERLVSCGCAVQNMLLMATAHGFGSSLTSGQSLQSQAVRALFGLRATEQAVCFINIGTVLEAKAARARPAAHALATTLHAQGAALATTLTPGLDAPAAVAS
ncbi:MAG: nitroreductase [Comamonadaceae bacterium]|nr:MAG: nitroreductase [Comamonadaceae bacterium]